MSVLKATIATLEDWGNEDGLGQSPVGSSVVGRWLVHPIVLGGNGCKGLAITSASEGSRYMAIWVSPP
jgi:hypothetical protein